jgi:hypothetical protein
VKSASTADALPRHEVLEALAHEYHHVQNELKREPPESTTRRRLEDRLLDVRERFDRLLAEWVQESGLGEEWEQHLHNRVPAPSGPPPIAPIVFRGRAEVSGSIVELRGKRGDEYEVVVDGSVVERIVAQDFPSNGPYRFRLDGTANEFDEFFDVSPEAIEALRRFTEEGGSPPWDHAPELLSDGLIDTHAGLTPRGHRALAASGRR